MKAVNLLPPEMRGSTKKPAAAPSAPKPQASGGAGPFVVLGVLALAVIAVAAYVLTSNTIKDREAQLARAQADHAAVVAQADALKPYADFQVMATARVATVEALAASRFDWEQALRDLAQAVPSNVHLIRLDGSLGGETGSASAIRGALNAPAIQLQGCTRTHGDVARLMSRLRNVRGVTRVSLASSDKETAQGDADPTGDPDGGRPAKLCPGGNPPTFDVVVFFEGAAAPAPAAATADPAAPATTDPAAPATTDPAAPAATPDAGSTATPAPEAATAPGATDVTTSPASTTQGGATP
jgi:Tfp pilus assembly protein PilN